MSFPKLKELIINPKGNTSTGGEVSLSNCPLTNLRSFDFSDSLSFLNKVINKTKTSGKQQSYCLSDRPQNWHRYNQNRWRAFL